MGYDVASLRAQFPALAAGTAHFDGPGGSQTPAVVAQAVADALTSPIANRGTVTAAERHADGIVLRARAAMADLLGADPRGIVFGRSATALLFDLARTMAATWGPGDEVVVTRLDHDANIRPWVLAAEAAGATVRWLDFDPGTTELDDLSGVLSPRTRLVAVTGGSNLVGTRPPVAAIAAQAREAGALTVVDGVHLTAHAGIDVLELGADVYACSPYKFCGPHCGVLAARPELLAELHPAKLAPSSDEVPERFELGTLPYELLAGTIAAVEFLAGLGGAQPDRRSALLAAMAAIDAHEQPLRRRIEEHLAGLPGVVVRSRAELRTPTLLVEFTDKNPADAYRYLADRKVNAPAGTFYALEASRRLGFGDTGSLRIGLSPYTDDSDVDRLLDGLSSFAAL